MRSFLLLTLFCVAGVAYAQEAAPPRLRSTPEQRDELGVTVYSGGFGLVRETRTLALGKGRSEVEFGGVAGTIQPETVQIHAVGAAPGMRVLEQSYQYDLLSPAKLLEKYVGRTVRVLRWSETKGRDEERDAVVLSAGEPPILRIGDEISWAFPGRISFPEIPKTLIARPTLVWLVDASVERQKVEVSYLANDLSWKADYVLVVNDADTAGDLNGWVTLDNRSGAPYANAKVQLVAGDVNRIMAPVYKDRLVYAAEARAAAPPQFREEGLFEYHLYTLERSTTLLENEQKQIALLEASGIKVSKRLVLRGEPAYFRMQTGEVGSTSKVAVSLEFENRESQKLGMPLPKGIMRVYKRDKAGGRQFLGEDPIDHTPRDERVRIRVGDAFDVVAERKQMDYKVIGSCRSESAWQIDLRNHKDEKVEVDVVEPASGDWEIVSSSLKATKDDAHTFSFRVPVPARGSARVEYRVRVRWC
ncbi:MAG: DUF4139 domain-containing protein [Myxococcota bacterium]